MNAEKKNGLLLTEMQVHREVCSEISNFDLGVLYDKIDHYFNTEGKSGEPVYILVYLDYEVQIGKYQNNIITFYRGELKETEYIKKIRIFDRHRELMFWRTGKNTFRGRFVDESRADGEKMPVIQARQIIWGTLKESSKDGLPGWTLITEKRGTALAVPLENITVDEHKKRVKIRTHNYIGFNELGQAGYMDSRIVGIETGGE